MPFLALRTVEPLSLREEGGFGTGRTDLDGNLPVRVTQEPLCTVNRWHRSKILQSTRALICRSELQLKMQRRRLDDVRRRRLTRSSRAASSISSKQELIASNEEIKEKARMLAKLKEQNKDPQNRRSKPRTKASAISSVVDNRSDEAPRLDSSDNDNVRELMSREEIISSDEEIGFKEDTRPIEEDIIPNGEDIRPNEEKIIGLIEEDEESGFDPINEETRSYEEKVSSCIQEINSVEDETIKETNIGSNREEITFTEEEIKPNGEDIGIIEDEEESGFVPINEGTSSYEEEASSVDDETISNEEAGWFDVGMETLVSGLSNAVDVITETHATHVADQVHSSNRHKEDAEKLNEESVRLLTIAAEKAARSQQLQERIAEIEKERREAKLACERNSEGTSESNTKTRKKKNLITERLKRRKSKKEEKSKREAEMASAKKAKKEKIEAERLEAKRIAAAKKVEKSRRDKALVAAKKAKKERQAAEHREAKRDATAKSEVTPKREVKTDVIRNPKKKNLEAERLKAKRIVAANKEEKRRLMKEIREKKVKNDKLKLEYAKSAKSPACEKKAKGSVVMNNQKGTVARDDIKARKKEDPVVEKVPVLSTYYSETKHANCKGAKEIKRHHSIDRQYILPESEGIEISLSDVVGTRTPEVVELRVSDEPEKEVLSEKDHIDTERFYEEIIEAKQEKLEQLKNELDAESVKNESTLRRDSAMIVEKDEAVTCFENTTAGNKIDAHNDANESFPVNTDIFYTKAATESSDSDLSDIAQINAEIERVMLETKLIEKSEACTLTNNTYAHSNGTNASPAINTEASNESSRSELSDIERINAEIKRVMLETERIEKANGLVEQGRNDEIGTEPSKQRAEPNLDMVRPATDDQPVFDIPDDLPLRQDSILDDDALSEFDFTKEYVRRKPIIRCGVSDDVSEMSSVCDATDRDRLDDYYRALQKLG